MKWTECKGKTGKPSTQFLIEEKFTFERAISAVLLKHDIQLSLAINLDHSPLSYIYQGKRTLLVVNVQRICPSEEWMIKAR